MEQENQLQDWAQQNKDTIGLVGGTLLALFGLSRRSFGGAVVAAVGGVLVYRSLTATSIDEEGNEQQMVNKLRGPVRVRKAITIQRPREEIFAFWRDFNNLPRFMKHLEKVVRIDERITRWTAKAPMGTVTWDAEITAETPGEMIAWRSLEGADIENHGVVTFTPAPGGRGTEVRVELEYNPPAGKLGMAVAKLFGEEPQSQVHEDLTRLRALLEAGEVPTIEGQPSDKVRREKGLLGTRLRGASLTPEQMAEVNG
jgi:uncharacterized membrane protein